VQKDAEADGGLDGAAEGRPRLGYAEVERVVHLLREQAVGRDRAAHVRSLQGDDDVLNVEVFEDAYVAQGRLDHRLGRGRAILLQEVFFERAAVDADADGYAALLGGADDLAHALDGLDVARIEPELIDAGLQSHQ